MISIGMDDNILYGHVSLHIRNHACPLGISHYPDKETKNQNDTSIHMLQRYEIEWPHANI